MADVNLLTLVGLGLTLEEYKEAVLDGEQPLYEAEPLRFGCTRCGQCCARPGDIYLTESDMLRISNFLRISTREFKQTWCVRDGYEWLMVVTKTQSCPFFRDDRCDIHAVKPIQCRTYPFWPEVVSTRHAWEEEAERCEGIGHAEGRLYAREEIEALLVGLGSTD